jgi:hypothetical protein
MFTALLFLVVAAILILSLTTLTVAATVRGQQEEEIQEESDGGLTATLNGESFTTGDTIAVNGTVEVRDINSAVCIHVIDPAGVTLDSTCADVSPDNTFTYSFQAGVNNEFDNGRPMVASGNYKMILTYLVPEEPASGEDFSEEVEFIFDYSHSERQSQLPTEDNNNNNETTTSAAPTSANTIRRTINVTAINMMVTQGLDYVQQLNSTITTTTIQTNTPNSENIIRDLEALQRTLQNVQGNLTGVTPLAQSDY